MSVQVVLSCPSIPIGKQIQAIVGSMVCNLPPVVLPRLPVLSPVPAPVPIGKQIDAIVKSMLRNLPSQMDSERVGRIPVTQNDLARMIAEESMKDGGIDPSKGFLYDAFYDSIKRMVYMLSERYSLTSKEEADDLAHDCMLRLMQKIRQFKPNLGRFTTWSWAVCTSVLKGKYHNAVRRRNIVSASDGAIDNHDDPDQTAKIETRSMMLSSEISTAIRKLIKKYPKKRGLIVALFCDPDQKGHTLPSKPNIKRAIEETGMTYTQVHVFYTKVARKFLRKELDFQGINK